MPYKIPFIFQDQVEILPLLRASFDFADLIPTTADSVAPLLFFHRSLFTGCLGPGNIVFQAVVDISISWMELELFKGGTFIYSYNQIEFQYIEKHKYLSNE